MHYWNTELQKQPNIKQTNQKREKKKQNCGKSHSFFFWNDAVIVFPFYHTKEGMHHRTSRQMRWQNILVFLSEGRENKFRLLLPLFSSCAL